MARLHAAGISPSADCLACREAADTLGHRLAMCPEGRQVLCDYEHQSCLDDDTQKVRDRLQRRWCQSETDPMLSKVPVDYLIPTATPHGPDIPSPCPAYSWGDVDAGWTEYVFTDGSGNTSGMGGGAWRHGKRV